MSWSQVYISGLDRSIEPTDEVIDQLLDDRYQLSKDEEGAILWAGSGTTLVKRDDAGACRGFAFMSFFSKVGASAAIDRINNYNFCGEVEKDDDNNYNMNTTAAQTPSPTPQLPPSLHAEMSNPKGKTKKKEKKGEHHLPDVRLRRQRAPPIRKHPVITSSDGKRTNLGRKTK